MDTKNSKRPERMTAIVGHELSRYNIDIAALSETRLAETGDCTESGAGYTFFWSGKAKDEPREAGVGFAIRTALVPKLETLPKGLSDRLMTLRIPLAGNTNATVISAYAPTMTYTEEEKEAFYELLSDTLHATPVNDKLLLLGDFNARVGSDYTAWPSVLGPHGMGKMNSNGLLLLTLCSEEELVITNTLFKQPDIHKATWMHPRSKHWHLIDYVITRRRDMNDIRVTRAMRGADCWTDHMMLRCKASFRIASRHRKQPSSVKKKLDVKKLDDPQVQDALRESLARNLQQLPQNATNLEAAWSSFRDTVHDTAKSVLGHPKKKHQDWFDDNDREILDLLARKTAAHAAWLSDKSSGAKHEAFKNLRSEAQVKIRQMKDTWWEAKAVELQGYADQHATKLFFSGLKSVYGPSSSTMTPVRAADGTLLTDKANILERWTAHFSQLLNRPSSVDEEALNNLPQRPVILALDESPTREESLKAISQLQTGKAPGPDGIPPEIYKMGGTALVDQLTSLFQAFWEKGELPQDLKDANIMHLYKNKGEKASCDNHRGISLLSIAGKILARILLNRMTEHLVDNVVSESQCGFRRNRGTIDMVFAVKQLQEKCIEQRQDLYLLFIDLTKAFDTVSRSGLWSILSKLGCPPKFVGVVRSFHDGMMARVIENGDVSEPFPVTNGVKQGCVLAPTLFSLLFAEMLSTALTQTSAGIRIRYRTDGRFFDLRRLKANTKVREALVRDFLFADDCALASHTEEDLQRLADCFSTAAKAFGLTISIKKTEVLLQSAPGSCKPEPAIRIDSNALKNVEDFTYLGSCLSSSGSLDKEITVRLAKASSAFGRLWTRVWQERGISKATKVAVYRAVVLTSLLYGCETWTFYRRHIQQLSSFHLRCLRKILGIHWEDRVTNQEVLRRAALPGIEALIMQSQLRWTGHVIRMEDNRLPKQLFCSELASGTRRQGGQTKRYKDSLKQALRTCNIPVTGWEGLAADRSAWRQATTEGVKAFERQRLEQLDAKRQARKERRANPAAAVACPVCSRVCASEFGLRSHMRRH